MVCVYKLMYTKKFSEKIFNRTYMVPSGHKWIMKVRGTHGDFQFLLYLYNMEIFSEKIKTFTN